MNFNNYQGYPLDPTGANLPDGVNVGDVLTWNGTSWVSQAPTGAGAKIVFSQILQPNTNNAATNLATNQFVQNLGVTQNIPNLNTSGVSPTTKIMRTILAMPEVIASTSGLYFGIYPNTVGPIVSATFTVSITSGSITAQIGTSTSNVLFPYANNLYWHNITSLLGAYTPAQLQGQIISVALSFAGNQPHNFLGVKYVYN